MKHTYGLERYPMAHRSRFEGEGYWNEFTQVVCAMTILDRGPSVHRSILSSSPLGPICNSQVAILFRACFVAKSMHFVINIITIILSVLQSNILLFVCASRCTNRAGRNSEKHYLISFSVVQDLNSRFGKSVVACCGTVSTL